MTQCPPLHRRVGRVISDKFTCVFYKKPLTSAPGFWLVTFGLALLSFLQGSAAFASAIQFTSVCLEPRTSSEKSSSSSGFEGLHPPLTTKIDLMSSLTALDVLTMWYSSAQGFANSMQTSLPSTHLKGMSLTSSPHRFFILAMLSRASRM